MEVSSNLGLFLPDEAVGGGVKLEPQIEVAIGPGGELGEVDREIRGDEAANVARDGRLEQARLDSDDDVFDPLQRGDHALRASARARQLAQVPIVDGLDDQPRVGSSSHWRPALADQSANENLAAVQLRAGQQGIT